MCVQSICPSREMRVGVRAEPVRAVFEPFLPTLTRTCSHRELQLRHRLTFLPFCLLVARPRSPGDYCEVKTGRFCQGTISLLASERPKAAPFGPTDLHTSRPHRSTSASRSFDRQLPSVSIVTAFTRLRFTADHLARHHCVCYRRSGVYGK